MISETGHWTADDSGDVITIRSDDFTHDVVLIVTGDFADRDQRAEYARQLAARMNAEAGFRRACRVIDAAFKSLCWPSDYAPQHVIDRINAFRKELADESPAVSREPAGPCSGCGVSEGEMHRQGCSVMLDNKRQLREALKNHPS